VNGPAIREVPCQHVHIPFQPYQRVETLNPANPKTLSPGKTATARIQIGESNRDDSRCNMKLRLQFKSPPNPKSIQAKLNGHSVELSPADSNWLDATVAPRLVKQGPNLVELVLATNADRELRWTDLMLQVRHRPDP
jgi:hypothetical protein